MDRKAIESIGKIALARLSDATKRAAKDGTTEPAGVEALSLIAALAEAIGRADKE